jgi:hypothetical protein
MHERDAWPPVRRVTLNLPSDIGQALRDRSVREERRVQVEATRLLRAALVAAGDLPEPAKR